MIFKKETKNNGIFLDRIPITVLNFKTYDDYKPKIEDKLGVARDKDINKYHLCLFNIDNFPIGFLPIEYTVFFDKLINSGITLFAKIAFIEQKGNYANIEIDVFLEKY